MSTEPRAELFVPGVDEHTVPSFTDIDGEVYPGETLIRTNTLTIWGDAEDAVRVHLYDILDDDGVQVHALRLVMEDEMGHSAQMTLAPVQLQQIGDWLLEKAQGYFPGGGER